MSVTVDCVFESFRGESRGLFAYFPNYRNLAIQGFQDYEPYAIASVRTVGIALLRNMKNQNSEFVNIPFGGCI